MKFLAKSRIATAPLVVAASSALCAQNRGPEQLQDHASIPDARHIIGQSVVATERSLEARDRYTFVERDHDRRLDSQGQLKSEKIDVTKMILVGLRLDQGRGSGNPVVLDGIIRGPRTARLAHRPGPDERW